MPGEPLTSAEIARRLGVTAQGMGRQIDTLVARGLLERGPHPGRGRPIDVRITEAGRTTFLAAARRARGEQQRTTGHLTEDEYGDLLGHLREIGRRAAGPPDDPGSDRPPG
jgi:DNA-binding MarR family transcriptional regulator